MRSILSVAIATIMYLSLSGNVFGETTFTSEDNWVTDYMNNGGDIKNVTGFVPSTTKFSANSYANEPTHAVPTHWDWREHGLVRGARNQGHCGSCWAFATDGITEIVWELQQQKNESPLLLAPQALVDCKTGENCDGGNFDALDFVKSNGLPVEASYPYTAANGACKNFNPFLKISSWAYVGKPNTSPTIQEMKQAIYDHGPISVSLAVSYAWQSYKSGVYNACDLGPEFVNHMTILVGWDDANGGNWIMLNSWGDKWGEAGYMRTRYLGTDGQKCNALGDQAAFVTVNGVDNLRTFLKFPD